MDNSGNLYVGGYFYDPFFGPYPWWSRPAYPYGYWPIYANRAVLRVLATPEDAAKALIDAAEKWALEAGFTELASDAEVGNEEGIRAHQKLRFREVGRSVHFVRPLRALRAGIHNPNRKTATTH